jgi:hypothetical protein
MAKAIQSSATVGEQPTVCEHCGSTRLVSIGLVAPKCEDCGRFTLTHLTWSKPEEVEVDIRIVEEQ